MTNCKVCTKCGKQKLLTSFYPHNGARDKRMNHCIKCKTFKVVYVKSIREKIKEYFNAK